jgi:hypothetical protein
VFDRHEACHAINLFDMNQKYADVLPLDEILKYLDAWRAEKAGQVGYANDSIMPARTTISLPASANRVRGLKASLWCRCKIRRRQWMKPIGQ